jgi:glutathione S-transferase
MTITITAFERSPDGGKGLARDTRVRWALEEVGQPYEVRPVSFRAMKEPAHLALHPFGQIPTYQEGDARLLESDKPWSKERLPLVVDRLRKRLQQPSDRLGDADWLDGGFSAGDLMMVSVLLRLRPSGLLNEFPSPSGYVARGEARPAYQRAFAAQAATNAR